MSKTSMIFIFIPFLKLKLFFFWKSTTPHTKNCRLPRYKAIHFTSNSSPSSRSKEGCCKDLNSRAVTIHMRITPNAQTSVCWSNSTFTLTNVSGAMKTMVPTARGASAKNDLANSNACPFKAWERLLPSGKTNNPLAGRAPHFQLEIHLQGPFFQPAMFEVRLQIRWKDLILKESATCQHQRWNS